jgi:hypothetical protein
MGWGSILFKNGKELSVAGMQMLQTTDQNVCSELRMPV